MAATVTKGKYYGFTQAELDAELASYKAAVKQRSAMAEAAGGGVVDGGRVNGQEVRFSFPAGVGSLDQWRQEIMIAQADLNDEVSTATDRTVGGFR